MVLGIPDLRVYPDPYVSFEVDHHKGGQVQAQAEKLNFAELLRYYWENVSLPPTPVPLRERFIRHVLEDEARAETFLAGFESGAAYLDVGCGASALQQNAAKKFTTVVGCDIAFRWLVLARKRLEEAALPANLICCCADFLPFPAKAFDVVTSVSVLEHLQAPGAVMGECGRVLKDSGRFFLFTTNRYSLAPEPHVRVWGVGFIPRRWMSAYVKWRRGLSYDKQRLLSLFEVRRLLGRASFSSTKFSLPKITPADLENRSSFERLSARVFGFIGRIPVLRGLLLTISPVIQVVAGKQR